MAKIDQRGRPRKKDRNWRHGPRVLALWLLVLAAYSNSFQTGLIFDSAAVIEQDPRIQEATPQNVRSILAGPYWYVTKTAGLYRPVTTLSYLMNYAVLGDGSQPAGYHWVNFTLHAINVALVYALGILILGRTGPATALAAIFGVHPLLAESVTNVVGRADLLATFGVLGGLFCYAKSLSVSGRSRLAWLACLMAAQGIGLFSKESAIVLPGIMLLYDLIWSDQAAWRARMPAYAVLIAPIAAFFYMRGGFNTHMIVEFTENPLVKAGFLTARLTAIEVIGKFLWLFFWPARLSADYSYNGVPLFGWKDAGAVIALATSASAAILLGWLVVRRRKDEKPILFFLAFFLIALAPTSNLFFIIGSVMAERFMYLPSVGLAGCAVAAADMLRQKITQKRGVPVAAWAAVGLACFALAVRTHTRNLDWNDERSLWTSTVNAVPASARPHYNLGTVLAQVPGELPDAIAQYQAALRIRPDYAEAHYNLGNAWALTPGRLPDAISEYEAALRSAPNLVEAHYSLGNALAHKPGRLLEAISEYQTAIRLQPNYVYAHNNLATALARTGRLTDAVGEFETALRLRPDYADAHNNLGNALAEIPGRLEDAIAEYKAALRLAPNDSKVHINLADALMQMPNRQPEAIAEYEAALRLRPDPELQRMLDHLRASLR